MPCGCLHPQQNILYLRRKLTHEECLNGYSQFFCKLYQKIATEKLTVMGPAITIYHNPSCDPFEFEIEFAVPIKEVVTGTRDFQNGLCVKSTLNGSYANITSIYGLSQMDMILSGHHLSSILLSLMLLIHPMTILQKSITL